MGALNLEKSKMNSQVKKLQNYQEIQTVENLKSSYRRLSLDLIVCAQHVPGKDLLLDKEMTEREDRLLFAQEEILHSLARYELSSEEDVVDLVEFWVNLQKTEDADLPSTQSVSIFNNVLSYNSRN